MTAATVGLVGASRRAAPRLFWIALVVIAAAALAIGSQRHSHPTLQQRTMAIAGVVRCPVCVGETAAQSNVPASIEIRATISRELQAGESRAAILSGLVTSYGPSILEQPSARGINVVLWVLPGLAVILALAGLVLAFLRWRPGRGAPVSAADRDVVLRLLGREPDEGGG